MANWTKNISNTIGLLGLEVSSKWGSMVWGTDPWGDGNSIIFDISKVVSNNLSSDSSQTKEMIHLVENSAPIDSTIAKDSYLHLYNTMIVSGDMNSEKLSQGSWDYVFPPNTTEGENRNPASWTSSTISSQTFTCFSASSTSWA